MTVERHDRDVSRPATTLACTSTGVWLWPGIALTERGGRSIRACDRQTIAGLVAKLHGPVSVHTGIGAAVERAAAYLTEGDVTRAERTLAYARLPPITTDGHMLMRTVAGYLNISVPPLPVTQSPRLWSASNVELFARLHVARTVESWHALVKAGYDPGEPRDERGQWATSGTPSGSATARRTDGIQVSTGEGRRQTSSRRGLALKPDVPFPHVILAGGDADDEESARRGLLEDNLDPSADIRSALYEIYTGQIRKLDPDNPELNSATGPDWVPTEEDVRRASYALDVAWWTKQSADGKADIPPTNWQHGWAARGMDIGRIRRETLAPNHPTIDDFTNGVARSIKSIDLNAPTYQNPARLEGRINAYVNELARYNGNDWAGVTIKPEEIETRMLDLVVPRDSETEGQRTAIHNARLRAWSLGLLMDVTEY